MAAINLGQTISYDSYWNCSQHKILKTSTNILIAFANQGEDRKLRYKTSEDNGVTWSELWTLVSSEVMGNFDVYLDSNDDILITYETSADYGWTRFVKMTYDSGTTWSIGSYIDVMGANHRRYPTITKRSNGDIWIVSQDSSYLNYIRWAYSTNGGTNWTTGAQDIGVNNSGGGIIVPKETYIWLFESNGDGQVKLYQWNTSWSYVTIIGSLFTFKTGNGAKINIFKVSDSEIYLSGETGSGIKVYKYNGSTWDSGTLISDNTNDAQPNMGYITSKPVICWSDYNGSQWDVAYRIWNGSSWDAQVNINSDAAKDYYTTIVPIDNTYLYVLYITGASSPYDIYFDLKSLVEVVTVEDEYSLKSCLKGLLSNFYTFKSSLWAYPRYYLKSVLLKEGLSSTFILKAILLSINSGSYLLKSVITSILRSLYLSYLTFDSMGLLSTGSEIGGTKIISNPNILRKIYVYLKNPGTSGNTIIDINKNGVSIFSNPSDRITIPYNDINKFAEKEVEIKLEDDDKITVDIDTVATDASDISVILHLDTYTGLNPIVKKIDFYDEEFLLDLKNVWVTDKLKVKIRFNNIMDRDVIPTVSIIKSDGSISSFSTGGWASLNMKNDTFISGELETTEDDLGSSKLIISGAKDEYGVEMSDYMLDFIITSIDDKIIYEKWTKEAENDIEFKIISDKISFSMDDSTYSTPTSWNDIMTVDITSATIGGNSSEGLKTLYIKFLSDDGLMYCKKSISLKYYYSAIGTWTAQIKKQMSLESNSDYIVFMTLPNDAKNIPIKTIRIYQDGEVLKEDISIISYIFSGLNLTINSDPSLRTITISSGAVVLGTGDYALIDEETLVLDDGVIEGRYDLICLDETGDIVVIKGTDGLTSNRAPMLNDMLYSKTTELSESFLRWPILPTYPDTYIPLYAIIIRKDSELDYGVVLQYDDSHLDFRPNLYTYKIILSSGVNTVIRVEIEDVAGRTSYKDFTIPKVVVNKQEGSQRVIRAYSDAEKTQEIFSGDRQTVNKIYFELEEGW